MELKTFKPTKPEEDLNSEHFKQQICLRCWKKPALENEEFCQECLEIRNEIERKIKERKSQPINFKKIERIIDEMGEQETLK